jgi:hypothetical protein
MHACSLGATRQKKGYRIDCQFTFYTHGHLGCRVLYCTVRMAVFM